MNLPIQTDYADLWTAKQVAEHLNVHRNWVYEAAATGDIPVIRFGGNLRFDPAAIRLWLRTRGLTRSRLETVLRERHTL